MSEHADVEQVHVAAEAERYVLGCVLRNGYQSWNQIAVLDEADFGFQENRKLFRYMRKLANHEVEPTFAEIYTAIMQRALEEQRAQKMENPPNAAYFGFPMLLELQEAGIDNPRLGNTVKLLRRQRIDREAYFLAHDIQKLAGEGISNNGPEIAELQRKLERLEGSLQINQQKQTVGSIIERCGGIDRLFMRPEGLVEWPISALNDIMNGGLAPGTVTVLAARPSDGKSALALQVAHSAASRELRTALFSLEMLEDELMKRLIAQNGRVSLTKIMDGHLTYEERAGIMQTVAKLDELPLEMFCGPQTISQITGQCLNAKEPYSFVVVDYLGLVDATGRFSTRQEKVQHVSQSFKALAMMLKKPILVLHQLGRDSEKENNRRPYLSDLRESGSIEQDANNVIFIHQPEKKQANGPRDMFDLIVGKQRNGPRDLSVKARFIKNHVRFADPDEKEEDSGQASMF